MIGSWADKYHHKSFAVETTTYAQKQIHYKIVSQTRSCSTCKDAMINITFKQKLLGKELIPANRSILVINNR